MTSLRLLQISDCHLSAEPHTDYRGQSPDLNLERFSPAVHAYNPHWLILTGDLSEDGSVVSYQRLAEWLLTLNTPAAWLPGNHDDRASMGPVFADAGFEAGPLLEIGGWQLVLLDSAWPGRPEGGLDADRMAVFSALDRNRPLGVFVHHHPVPVSVWIDRVRLEQPERLWQQLQSLEQTRFVAFGHVHQRFRKPHRLSARIEIECMAAPSTAANSLPDTERFIPEPGGPMARWFQLEPTGAYYSGFLSVVD